MNIEVMLLFSYRQLEFIKQLMKQQENDYDAIDKNPKTNVLSQREKKLAIFAIAIFSFLILILVGLIAEAYVNQHPALKFLQYAAFKPGMEILGSISLCVMYIGVLFYFIVWRLLLLYDYQWRKISIVSVVVVSFFLLLLSFVFLFTSFNWQIEYAKYKYLSFVLLTIGVIGQMQKKTISEINSIESYSLLDKILKFPFHILMFIGLIINVVTL